MDSFGLGSKNLTPTEYLSSEVIPALDYSLTSLIKHLDQTNEIEKWKELKEEEYHKLRRENRKKEKQEAGESISESEEWVDSEGSLDENQASSEVFYPLKFVADKILEYKSNL